MFIPGETITHAFVIPFSKEEINLGDTEISVTYVQDGHTILERQITSREVEPYYTKTGEQTRFEVTLTQEESLLFKDLGNAFVQINIKIGSNNNQSRMTSQPIKLSNGIQFKREVIS